MKKFGMIIIVAIITIVLSGCGGTKISLPFMEENKDCHYTIARDDEIIGAIDAHWKEEEWEVILTSIEENEEVNYTWEGKEYSYQEVSSSETIRMDEESFEAFIEGCQSDDSISLTEY